MWLVPEAREAFEDRSHNWPIKWGKGKNDE
jgi:hypothetical protein